MEEKNEMLQPISHCEVTYHILTYVSYKWYSEYTHTNTHAYRVMKNFKTLQMKHSVTMSLVWSLLTLKGSWLFPKHRVVTFIQTDTMFKSG